MIAIIAVILVILALVGLLAWYEGKTAMRDLECQYWYCDCCLDYNEIELDTCPKCGNKRY